MATSLALFVSLSFLEVDFGGCREITAFGRLCADWGGEVTPFDLETAVRISMYGSKRNTV